MFAVAAVAFLQGAATHAQWEIERSNSKASLRGVISVDGRVAWASGAHGTVLRTLDGGAAWQACSIPAGAEALDFRGIQAWDRDHAIVLSAGPGEQSRLYRTADGCRHWQLLLTNSNKEGFWDALRFVDPQHGFLLGDPVDGRFVLMRTSDGGTTWVRDTADVGGPVRAESVFAASNSSLLVRAAANLAFCTGGAAGAKIVRSSTGPYPGKTGPGEIPWGTQQTVEGLANATPSASSGCFSLAESRDGRGVTVAVGGDFSHPEATNDTAWTTAGASDANREHPLFNFAPAKTMPHGYRSAVAFEPGSRSWIAIGPNGTDRSIDDGQTWKPLQPGAGDADGVDREWNALSLPFAVGAHGRIGKLRTEALAGP